jgi:hypothetical protein
LIIDQRFRMSFLLPLYSSAGVSFSSNSLDRYMAGCIPKQR